jgi:N-acetylmuramoyl-L-alanine amidase
LARWPDATWQGLPRNYGPGIVGPIGVTLHHQAGSGNPYQVYLSRGVSAHFWIPYQGRPVQHVDTGQQSWHGMSLNRRWIGVETEGCGAPPHAQPLNENQLKWFAELMRWANRVHGIPLQLSGSESTPGLNYHRVAVATGCPCDVRVRARDEILRRARGGASAPAPPKPQPVPPKPVYRGDDPMVLTFDIDGATQLFEINESGDLFRRGRPAGQANYDAATRLAAGEFTGSPSLFVRGAGDRRVFEVYAQRRAGGVVSYRFDLSKPSPRSWERVSHTSGVK